MSRIRSLHPGIFTDERYMALGFPARELIKGIWCEADDQGVFEWKPLTLKAKIMPADNVEITALLEELVDGLFLGRFEYAGHSYGAVRNFRRFQRPKKPNQTFVLPDELRQYVGLSEDIGAQSANNQPQVPHQFPTEGGKSPQMEDEGGRMKEGGLSSQVSDETFKERGAHGAQCSPPEDFQIDDRLIAEAAGARASAGLPPANLRAEAAKFALRKGLKTREGWLKWAIDAHAKPAAEPPTNGSGTLPEPDPKPDRSAMFWADFPNPEAPAKHVEWAARLRSWAESSRGFWPATLGPKPGEPGCEAPPDLAQWAMSKRTNQPTRRAF